MSKAFRNIAAILTHGNFPWLAGLAFISVVAFWPVLNQDALLKYDALDYYFPSRHLLAQYISDGQWPLWCPYQNLGYPIYSDPQSGVWYPLAWLLAAVSGYPLWMISFELVLHVFVAGWGMFALSRTFGMKHDVSFLAALSYMLCGVMIGNAQHLTWIISAAWIPVVLHVWLLFLRSPSFRYALAFAVSMFLLFSGGYPAFFFVLLYLLVILLIVRLFGLLRAKSRKEWLRLLFFSGVAGLLFVAFSSAILYSGVQVLQWISRGSGVTREMALFGAFTPESFISFISPFSVALSDFSRLNTDLSMSNGYFGTVTLLFFIAGVFVRKSEQLRVFFWFGILSLLLSTGDWLPIRAWFYDYVPLMNLFRFPALFRLFFILAAVLVAANAAQHFVHRKSSFPFQFRMLWVFAGMAAVAGSVFIISHEHLDLDYMSGQVMFHFTNSSYQQHLAIDLSLASFVIVFGALMLFFGKNIMTVLRFLLLLLALQMVISVRTNAPYTVYYDEFSFEPANNFINQLPDQFPELSQTPVILNEQQAPRVSPFWKNLNMFQRQISAEGFTPFKSAGFVFLQDSLSPWLNQILKNPPIYCSNQLFYESEVMNMGEPPADSAIVIVGSNQTMGFRDTINKDNLISVISFKPNEIELEVNCSEEIWLVFQQNHHPGWNVIVNGQPHDLSVVNYCQMGVQLPAGHHFVNFEFNDPAYKTLFVVSASMWSLALLLLLIIYVKRRKGDSVIEG